MVVRKISDGKENKRRDKKDEEESKVRKDSLTTQKKSGTPKQTYSEEKLTAVAEAFALSDICTGRKGKIPATEICNAMRMLGQCPTQLEVNEVIIEVEMLRRKKQAEADEMAKVDKKRKRKKKGSGRPKCGEDEDEEEEDTASNKITFPEFITILEKYEKPLETEASIIAAFREFDRKGKGVISTKKLMKIMTGMGEKLSTEEVDEMVKYTNCYNGDGKVKYEKFVKMMFVD